MQPFGWITCWYGLDGCQRPQFDERAFSYRNGNVVLVWCEDTWQEGILDNRRLMDILRPEKPFGYGCGAQWAVRRINPAFDMSSQEQEGEWVYHVGREIRSLPYSHEWSQVEWGTNWVAPPAITMLNLLPPLSPHPYAPNKSSCSQTNDKIDEKTDVAREIRFIPLTTSAPTYTIDLTIGSKFNRGEEHAAVVGHQSDATTPMTVTMDGWGRPNPWHDVDDDDDERSGGVEKYKADGNHHRCNTYRPTALWMQARRHIKLRLQALETSRRRTNNKQWPESHF